MNLSASRTSLTNQRLGTALTSSGQDYCHLKGRDAERRGEKGKREGGGKEKGEGGKGESRGCVREESGGRWMGGGREREGRSVGREGEGKEWLEREGVIGGGRVVGGRGSDGRR